MKKLLIILGSTLGAGAVAAATALGIKRKKEAQVENPKVKTVKATTKETKSEAVAETKQPKENKATAENPTQNN